MLYYYLKYNNMLLYNKNIKQNNTKMHLLWFMFFENVDIFVSIKR